MPKPPTSERGRRVAFAPPPPEIRRRFAFGSRDARRKERAVDEATEPSFVERIDPRNVIVLLASLAGVGVAFYLTLAHFSAGLQLSCPETGAINCEAVTRSPESYVFGIPVSLLGLIYFVVMTGFSLPVVWRSKVRVVAQARLALAIAGIGFVCYLVYSELFVIGKICLWCTGVHVLTLILFAVITTGWRQMSEYATDPLRR
ncbi:MAG: vitamin K epoxide reductase family protein [Acidimicrobiales bacterium]